jgi:hypothetical protein
MLPLRELSGWPNRKWARPESGVTTLRQIDRPHGLHGNAPRFAPLPKVGNGLRN